MRAVESECHNASAADINKHSFGSVRYLLGCRTQLQRHKWSSYQACLKHIPHFVWYAYSSNHN